MKMSANKNGPCFVARPITGDTFVEDGTLEKEMGGRTEGIQNVYEENEKKVV